MEYMNLAKASDSRRGGRNMKTYHQEKGYLGEERTPCNVLSHSPEAMA